MVNAGARENQGEKINLSRMSFTYLSNPTQRDWTGNEEVPLFLQYVFQPALFNQVLVFCRAVAHQ